MDKYDPDIFWVDASFGGTKEGHHRKTLFPSEYIGQQQGVPIRSANGLEDVVNKNGIFLLNIPPMADGSFPLFVHGP